MLILAASLLAVLSGCIIVGSTPAIQKYEFATNWVRLSDNAYVICNDQASVVGYRFVIDSSASVSSWTEKWTGSQTNAFDFTDTKTLTSSGVTYDASTRTVTVLRTFNNNSPLGKPAVSTQAVIVTPNPPFTPKTSEVGKTNLQVVVNVLDQSSVTLSGASFPVFNACK